MTSKTFIITICTLLLVFSAAWVGLHKYNNHLREKLAGQRLPSQQMLQLREENARLVRLLVQTDLGTGMAEQAMATELDNTRTELRELKLQRERAATVKSDRNKKEQAALDVNGNPEIGPVRIENFRNLGRASPAAAFQSLIWAAVTGAERELAESIALEPESRTQILELLAGFSPDEHLVSVFIAADVFKGAAAGIISQTNDGPDRAILRVHIANKTRDTDIPMRRAGESWQLAITDSQVKELLTRLREAPPAP